jgi:hypothetical protein
VIQIKCSFNVHADKFPPTPVCEREIGVKSSDETNQSRHANITTKTKNSERSKLMAEIGWTTPFNNLAGRQAAKLAEAAVDGYLEAMGAGARGTDPEVPF